MDVLLNHVPYLSGNAVTLPDGMGIVNELSDIQNCFGYFDLDVQQLRI